MKQRKALPAQKASGTKVTVMRVALGVVAVVALGAFWLVNQSSRSDDNVQPTPSVMGGQAGDRKSVV